MICSYWSGLCPTSAILAHVFSIKVRSGHDKGQNIYHFMHVLFMFIIPLWFLDVMWMKCMCKSYLPESWYFMTVTHKSTDIFCTMQDYIPGLDVRGEQKLKCSYFWLFGQDILKLVFFSLSLSLSVGYTLSFVSPLSSCTPPFCPINSEVSRHAIASCAQALAWQSRTDGC